MRIYTVHIKPDVAASRAEPVFVREGFNLYAFLLTFLWAFYRRLWVPAALLLICYVLLVVMGEVHVLSAGGIVILQLTLQVIAGLYANDWQRADLSRRGYIIADIATGDSLLRAEQRYFERYLSAAS